jgi:hypothetical protein
MTLAAILLILSLSILDAIFTMDLVSHGAEELNPVMAYYLNGHRIRMGGNRRSLC